MPFERSVEQQPVKRGVLAKRSDDLRGNVAEQSPVVPAFGQFVQFHKPAFATQGGFLFVQDRVVEILFAREMAEENGFAHAGGRRYVLGFRAAESVARETIDRYPQKLPAAVFARHPR